MIDVTEILVHWYAGRSKNELSGSLGVDRKTIRKYVAPAVAAGIAAGRAGEERGGVGRAGPGVVPRAGRHAAAAGDLARDRRAPRLHPRAGQGGGADVDDPPAAAGRARPGGQRGQLPPLCRGEPPRGGPPVAGDGAGARGRPRPGRRPRSTTGMLGRWIDPATGKLRTVWAFVMVLACSRHMFVRPVLQMDQRAWTESHVEAFGFFGGVPAGWCPTTCAPGWTGPTSMTRRSTGPMPSSPRTTAPWSTRPGR